MASVKTLLHTVFDNLGKNAKEIIHKAKLTKLPIELSEDLINYLINHSLIDTNSLSLLLQISSYDEIDLSPVATKLGSEDFKIIETYGNFLKKLSLRSSLLLQGSPLVDLCKSCSKLTYLDLSYCSKILSAHVSDFCSMSDNLETLKLERCLGLKETLRISNASLKNLYFCVSTNIETMQLDCPNLEYLDINECLCLKEIVWVPKEKKLKYWNAFRCSELEDESFLNIACKVKNDTLEDMNLFSCKKLTSLTIRRMAPNLPLLKRFIVSNCINVDDQAVVSLSQHCANLEIISLNSVISISNIGITALAKNCKKLHSAEMADIRISDEGLIAFAKSAPQLLRVDITDNISITSYGVQELIRSCPDLVLVSLVNCNVDDFAFSDLEYPAFSHLKLGSKVVNWNFAHVPISDKTLTIIGKVCPVLIELDISSNSMITDEGVENILKGCPIRSLYMHHCYLISDKTCQNIAKYCKYLKEVDFYGCPKITLEGIKELTSPSSVAQDLNDINLTFSLLEQLPKEIKGPQFKSNSTA